MANVPTILGAVQLLAEQSTQAVAETAPEKVNNPILPTANEFFWAAVFFVLLWILMKYVLLPPVRKVMDQRTQTRLDDLRAAEEASAQMEAAQERYEASLAGARAEAVAKVEAARSEAEAYRRETLTAAEADAATTRAAGAADAERARSEAMAELQGSLADIVVGAAEAVVERPIDRTRQVQVIEDYVNRAEPSR